jgi:threonyl-tRNA synthetase
MKVIDLVLYVFKALGFENYSAQVSLRDPENKENTSVEMKTGKEQKQLLFVRQKSKVCQQ